MKKISAPFDIYGIVSAFGFIAVSIINFHIRMSKLKRLIKDRKKIQDNKSIFEHVFNIMTNGMIILGRDRQILHSNQSIQAFLDCEPHEILEYLSRVHYKARRRLIQTPEVTENVLDDICYCLSLDLNVKKCLGTASIRDLSVDISVSNCEFLSEKYLIVLFTDVTPILALESIEIENSCKTMLLRYIPHELQTPVVGLVGCIETVLADITTTSLETIKESMKVMDVSVKLLLHFIRNINDYVKMLTDSFTIEKAHINLVNLIYTVKDLFVQQTTYQKLNFHVRIDPTLPESIYTDSRRLTQVLVSLLSNSLKYTFTGRIELIVHCTRANTIKFSIIDTGIGISSEKLDIIQTQIANSPTDSSVIGLEIANSIIDHLGGTPLKLKSGPSCRTKASFSIPSELSDPLSSNSGDSLDGIPEEQNSLSRIRLPTASLAKMSQVVMIVDDHDFNRQVLHSILTQNKIPCIECKDGYQAIIHVRDYDNSCKPIKVVIMDIDMPIVNGWEATERILALYNSQEIKSKPLIVAYSAFSAPEDIERSYQAGMISYINKPAPAEYLISTIRSLLSSH